MKRLCILCLAMLLLLCGCGAKPADDTVPMGDDVQPYYPEEPVPVVVPLVERLENGDVTVTLHAGLLVNGESEELSEQQVKDGYLSGVRNEDDSVTYTIAGDRYEDVKKAIQDDCRYHLVEGAAGGSFESVYKVEVNEEFSFITATAQTIGYNPLDAGEACLQSAIYAMRAQAYDIDAVGYCEMIVVDETTGAEHERHRYPDELRLFPAE